MATLKDIRKKIKAIQSTKKITSAMKMVAASKLKKVQDRMLNYRPYANNMAGVISELSMAAEKKLHPLLEVRQRQTVELLILTSDRGLCGAFNANILKAAHQRIKSLRQDGINVSVSVIGRKALDFCRRRDITVRKAWTGLSGRVGYESAVEIAGEITANYIDGNIDEVHLLYNSFKSMMSQEITLVRLLPIGVVEAEQTSAPALTTDFIYEPSPQILFERLLPKYIEIQAFRALLESSAAEESARMSAMENATKNCGELINKTTLIANKLRQASITGELMDMVGGVEALKS
ncbi:MAG: ATP synthase F1 subunit gamma [Nitrospirae bacterium]|nr:ATP synthase F1 subunit gamma [Nitrospirota bacterium]